MLNLDFRFSNDLIEKWKKENTKFKRKVHRKAEGASILVMPVDFVETSKIVFLRMEAATELPGFLEVKMRSRFVVLIIGPRDRSIQLFEAGRAMATCLADDVSDRDFLFTLVFRKLRNSLASFNHHRFAESSSTAPIVEKKFCL